MKLLDENVDKLFDWFLNNYLKANPEKCHLFATFSELLSKDKSVTIHQRNLQLLATEIFKTKTELNPKIMEEIFTFKNLDYNLRNNPSLKIGNLKTVYYGTESLANLGAKIWNLLPNEYKELKSLSTFTSRISNWVTDECPFRMQKLCCKYWFCLIVNN